MKKSKKWMVYFSLIIVTAIIINEAFAQMATYDATAQINATILQNQQAILLADQKTIIAAQSDMVATTKAMAAQQTIIDNLNKSIGYIESAETIIKYGQMLESMLCQMNQMNTSFNKSKHSKSCKFQLEYGFALMSLSTAKDIMQGVLTKGLSQSPADRLNGVKNATESLNKAFFQMSALTQALNALEKKEAKETILLTEMQYLLNPKFGKKQ